MQSLARHLQKIVKPVALRQGFADVRIISQWSKIVGHEMSRFVRPLKVSRQVLWVEVADSGWGMQVMHQSLELAERINSYFGFGAVKRIQIQQTHFTPKAEKIVLPKPSEEMIAGVNQDVAYIQDEKLRNALVGLGSWVRVADNVKEQTLKNKEVA